MSIVPSYNNDGSMTLTDTATGQTEIYDRNGNRIGGTHQTQQAPSTSATLANIAKEKAKDYILDKTAEGVHGYFNPTVSGANTIANPAANGFSYTPTPVSLGADTAPVTDVGSAGVDMANTSSSVASNTITNPAANGFSYGADTTNGVNVGTSATSTGTTGATGLGTSGGIGGSGIGAAGSKGSYLGMAMDAYNAYKGSTSGELTKEQQAAEFQKNVAMAVADYFTGGLAGTARSIGLRTGFGRKMEAFADKGAKPLASVLAKIGGKAFNGLSTKNKQLQRAQELHNQGVTGYDDFYNATSKGWEDPVYGKTGTKGNYGGRIDASKSSDFQGYDENGYFINNKYATTGNVKDLMEHDVEGSQGNFATFGNDYLGKYTPEQRKQISQALLDAGMYRSDHGDLVIDDQDKAKQIAAGIVGNSTPSVASVAPKAPNAIDVPSTPQIENFKPQPTPSYVNGIGNLVDFKPNTGTIPGMTPNYDINDPKYREWLGKTENFGKDTVALPNQVTVDAQTQASLADLYKKMGVDPGTINIQNAAVQAQNNAAKEQKKQNMLNNAASMASLMPKFQMNY